MENYWKKRNRLVDAVLAVTPQKSIMWKSDEARTESERELVEIYREALQDLADFDDDNGGTPIL